MIVTDLHDVIADYMLGMIETYGWPANMDVPLVEMWDNIDWSIHFAPLNHSEFLASLKPVRLAPWGMKTLYNAGKQLVILTAARDNGHDSAVTERWLDKFDIPYDDIVFAGSHEAKVDWLLARRLTIECMIEDHPYVMVPAQEAGIPVLRFSRPWNAGEVDIPAANGWNEVVEYILDE